MPGTTLDAGTSFSRRPKFASLTVRWKWRTVGIIEPRILPRAIRRVSLRRAVREAWRAAHEFLTGELAIAVFVELRQGGGSVFDFIGVNDAVVVCVQRADQRHHGRPAFTARTGTAVFTAGGTIAVRRRIAGILGRQSPGRNTERHGTEQGEFS